MSEAAERSPRRVTISSVWITKPISFKIDIRLRPINVLGPRLTALLPPFSGSWSIRPRLGIAGLGFAPEPRPKRATLP